MNKTNTRNNNTKGNGKKEFAPSIGFWPTKSGTGFTVYLDEKVMAEISKAQTGGRLYLKEVGSENPSAPTFRVTIFPPEEQKQDDASL